MAYKIVNGTYYHEETPDAVIRVLERVRQDRTRIRLRYGNTESNTDRHTDPAAIGCDWLDEHDCEGTVGRSQGSEKIPLLINNVRSIGGGGILDHCIVRILESKSHRVLYSHPEYHHPKFVIVPLDEFMADVVALKSGGKPLPYEVQADGKAHARFGCNVEAERWIRKMSL